MSIAHARRARARGLKPERGAGSAVRRSAAEPLLIITTD
jgi:hypothetical protein